MFSSVFFQCFIISHSSSLGSRAFKSTSFDFSLWCGLPTWCQACHKVELVLFSFINLCYFYPFFCRCLTILKKKLAKKWGEGEEHWAISFLKILIRDCTKVIDTKYYKHSNESCTFSVLGVKNSFCEPEHILIVLGICTLYNAILRIARNLLETSENIKIESHSFYHIICDWFSWGSSKKIFFFEKKKSKMADFQNGCFLKSPILKKIL